MPKPFTVATVRAYLAGLDPNDIAGKPGSACQCPLANAFGVHSMSRGGLSWYDPNQHVEPVHPWMKAFMWEVDNSDEAMLGDGIKAHRCGEILDFVLTLPTRGG